MQSEIVIVGGAIVFAGQIAAMIAPAGPVRDGLRFALPVLVTFIQRARSVPAQAVEQLIDRVERMHRQPARATASEPPIG